MRKPIALAAAIASLSGCFTMSKPPQSAKAPSTAESPVVEAYMEYVGPPERWAGPQTLVVHLTARDPELRAAHGLPADRGAGRAARAALEQRPGRPAPARARWREPISYGLARDSLTQLAASLKESADPAFAGCLYPLRLKLVRANGTVTERNGCRNLEGWPVVLSQVTHQVLTASIHPTTTDHAITRAVASH